MSVKSKHVNTDTAGPEKVSVFRGFIYHSDVSVLSWIISYYIQC